MSSTSYNNICAQTDRMTLKRHLTSDIDYSNPRKGLKMRSNCQNTIEAASEPWKSEVSEELIKAVRGFISFLQSKLSAGGIGGEPVLIQKKIEELQRWLKVAVKCVVDPDNFDQNLGLVPEPVDIHNLLYQGRLVRVICFGNGKPASIDLVGSNDSEEEEAKFCDFSAENTLLMGYVVLKTLRNVDLPAEKRQICMATTCTFDPRTKQVVRINDEEVVLKIVHKTVDNEFNIRLRREARVQGLLTLLDHENLNKLQRLGEDKTRIYSVSAYGGNQDLVEFLSERCQDSIRLSSAEVKQMFKPAVEALAIVHNLGIAHRDLSLENFVKFSSSSKLEVIDWGHCCKVETSGYIPYEGALGKPRYFAPELVKEMRVPEDTYYDALKADVFALGVCIYTSLTGGMPFEEMGYNPRTANFLGNLRGVLKKQNIVDENSVNLLEKMLHIEPEKRISMNELLTHPFFI